jgi:hypothetical protein
VLGERNFVKVDKIKNGMLLLIALTGIVEFGKIRKQDGSSVPMLK